MPLNAFNFDNLIKFTPGWTGAEIEQCVISALTRARLEDRDITEHDVISIAAKQVPLSRTMKEQIEPHPRLGLRARHPRLPTGPGTVKKNKFHRRDAETPSLFVFLGASASRR